MNPDRLHGCLRERPSLVYGDQQALKSRPHYGEHVCLRSSCHLQTCLLGLVKGRDRTRDDNPGMMGGCDQGML